MDGRADIQLAPVRGYCAVGQIQVQIGQVLIAAGILLVARPQRYFVQLQMFMLGIAKDHGSQAAVAYRQGLGLPVLRRLPVAERQGGCRARNRHAYQCQGR